MLHWDKTVFHGKKKHEVIWKIAASKRNLITSQKTLLWLP